MSLVILNNTLSQSNENAYLVLLKQKRITNNKDIGRIFGSPVQKGNFIFDSGLYRQLYICNVPIGKSSHNNELFVNYIIGRKEDNNIYVTFDTNFDSNFLDEVTIKIDSSICNNCDLKNWAGCVSFDKTNITVKNPDSFALHIVPPCCFPNVKRKSEVRFLDTFNIAVEEPLENTGKVIINNKRYGISVKSLFPKINFSDQQGVNLKIYRNNEAERKYDLTDTVKIDNSFFYVSYLSAIGDSLILKRIQSEKVEGYSAGFFPYNFREKDILSDEVINPYEFRGKFLLMEFWGTWCGPCRSIHNDLINFLKENSRKINYVGIAYDDSVQLVKNYIEKSPETQRQIFIGTGTKKSIIDLFRITSYPTFILIDPKSKIVFRDTGIKGFHNLLVYFKSSQ
jgi:thiol-disulfide isomerase/thioredoxin